MIRPLPPTRFRPTGGRGRTWRRADRGYTLIEMIVLTSILLLVATMVMPNLVAMKHSRDVRSEEETILQMTSEARNDAIKYGAPITLKFDGNDLVLQREIVPGSNSPTANGGGASGSVTSLAAASGMSSSPTLTNQNDQVATSDPTQVYEIRRITLPDSFSAESAQRLPYANPAAQIDQSAAAAGSTDTASWQWTVYPDGTQDGGSVTFRIDNGEKTLLIPTDGSISPSWTDGTPPTPQDTKWPVGDILRRS